MRKQPGGVVCVSLLSAYQMFAGCIQEELPRSEYLDKVSTVLILWMEKTRKTFNAQMLGVC